MKNVLEYKDFVGSVNYSGDDEVFFGKIEGINDLVNFEGESVKELKNAFIEAVEDYIEMCNELGKDPMKTFKGSFNIRISQNTHRKAYFKATKEGLSLNQFVQKAIDREIAEA